MSIAALVTGICGLVILPVIGSILGIVFGIIGMKSTRETGRGGRGFALTGIITGAVGLVFWLLIIITIATVTARWGLYYDNWHRWAT